jgi:hypothetical protein
MVGFLLQGGNDALVQLDQEEVISNNNTDMGSYSPSNSTSNMSSMMHTGEEHNNM